MHSWEQERALERALGMQLRPAVDHVLLVLVAFQWDCHIVALDVRLFCSQRCWPRGAVCLSRVRCRE